MLLKRKLCRRTFVAEFETSEACVSGKCQGTADLTGTQVYPEAYAEQVCDSFCAADIGSLPTVLGSADAPQTLDPWEDADLQDVCSFLEVS